MARRTVRRQPPTMPSELRRFSAEDWIDPDTITDDDPVTALRDARQRWREARHRHLDETLGGVRR